MARGPTKRAGRKARLAHRARGPAENPCPPGQIGGTYAPSSEVEIHAIHKTALDLLARLGIREVPARLADGCWRPARKPGKTGASCSRRA